MQVLAKDKQQVLKDLCKRAMDDQLFWFPLGLFSLSQNQTEVHPGEMIYALLWLLYNYLFALLGSILELETCEQRCIQYSRSKKEFLQDFFFIERRQNCSLLLTLILYPVSPMLIFSSSHSYTTTTLTISEEMVPPCYFLIHDINMIEMSMHPRTWMRLT